MKIKLLAKIKKWYLSLPDRKRHIELITAALSVPMMVTVIIVNLYSIKKNNNTTATVTSTPIQVVVENPAPATGSNTNPPKDLVVKTTGNVTVVTPTITPTLTPTPTKTSCKQDIGEIEILSPQEGEIIAKDNICINISTDSDYCGVTWAYKLDSSDWSNYTSSDSACIYNITAGKKTLQIKVKSSVVDKSVVLQRTFTYQATTPTLTTAPNSN